MSQGYRQGDSIHPPPLPSKSSGSGGSATVSPAAKGEPPPLPRRASQTPPPLPQQATQVFSQPQLPVPKPVPSSPKRIGMPPSSSRRSWLLSAALVALALGSVGVWLGLRAMGFGHLVAAAADSKSPTKESVTTDSEPAELGETAPLVNEPASPRVVDQPEPVFPSPPAPSPLAPSPPSPGSSTHRTVGDNVDSGLRRERPSIAPAPRAEVSTEPREEISASASDDRSDRDATTDRPLSSPPRPASPSNSSRPVTQAMGVTLYEDIRFGGPRETLYTDDPDLGDNSIRRDTVSSLRVDPGCTAVLFEQTGFKGRSVAVTGEVEDLRPSPIGHDSLASIEVHCGEARRGKRQAITLYEHTNFEGAEETFYYDDPRLRDNLIGGNSASSVRVDPGCRVTLYKKRNYRGSSIVLMEDQSDLRASAIGNDAVASLRVKCESWSR